MFARQGFFGRATVDTQDVFGGLGFFGVLGSEGGGETFFILDEEGNRILGEEGDKIKQEEAP